MNAKRILALVLALVMALGVFTACSKTDGGNTPAPTQNGSENHPCC